MSSSTKPTASSQTSDEQQEDTVRVIAQRLIFICVTVFAWWIAFIVMLYFVSFPPIQPVAEGQPAVAPEMLSVRLASGLLITHFLSVLCTQAFAARRILSARLISNTMFGGLILSLCVAISLVAGLVPPNAIPYLKKAIEIAYNPAFVIANFLLCTLTGFLLYRFREARLACMVELYWSLGLMFLLGLAIALLQAVAKS